jgi:GT2 family glycosyltransferase
LTRFLETVFPDDSNHYQLLLVDNATMEIEEVEKILKTNSRISYINTGSNLNYGKANNIGIKQAISEGIEYVGIINPDTWFSANWLPPILEFLKKNPSYGCISPLQLKYENNDLANWTKKQLQGATDEIELLLSKNIIDRPFLEGSCMIFPTQVLKISMGFDPIYEMYYEELDLCRRLQKHGFKLGIFTQSSYHHFSSENSPSLERSLKIDKSQFIYILTNPNSSFARNIVQANFWLIRKGFHWIKGQKKGFIKLVCIIIRYLSTAYWSLFHKWKNDSGIKTIEQK